MERKERHDDRPTPGGFNLDWQRPALKEEEPSGDPPKRRSNSIQLNSLRKRRRDAREIAAWTREKEKIFTNSPVKACPTFCARPAHLDSLDTFGPLLPAEPKISEYNTTYLVIRGNTKEGIQNDNHFERFRCRDAHQRLHR